MNEEDKLKDKKLVRITWILSVTGLLIAAIGFGLYEIFHADFWVFVGIIGLCILCVGMLLVMFRNAQIVIAQVQVTRRQFFRFMGVLILLGSLYAVEQSLKPLNAVHLQIQHALGKRNFRELVLENANLQGARLPKIDLMDARLPGADLRGADLYDAVLRRCDLRGADLTLADLRETDLIQVKLSGANLTQADLSGSTMWGADLTGAILTGTVMENLREQPEQPTPAP